ncbi:MAG: hypothetical protein RSE00_00885 [Clostridia bacterium]
MKKFLKIFFIIIGVIATLIIALIIGLKVISSNTTNADEYKMGEDLIPSLKAVVGKRQVSGIGASVENGITTKEIKYKTETTAGSDVNKYMGYLVENENFFITKNNGTKVEISKKSVDSGKIIMMTFEKIANEYVFTIKKGVGELKVY